MFSMFFLFLFFGVVSFGVISFDLLCFGVPSDGHSLGSQFLQYVLVNA